MIPASFEYVRPRGIGEAVEALGSEDAKVLAGGQSLLPLLRLRLAAPSVLVDVGRITAMHGIRDDGHSIVIGAATTHAEVIADALIAEHAPLVAAATRTVADPAIRHRGTFGGSLAHADPAGDLPSVALALDATMVVAGPEGMREIPASEFFVDYLQTAMSPNEVLIEIRVPKLGPAWGFHYEKFQRTAQQWAIVGVAAAVRRENGNIAEARIALTNMGPTPIRATAVEAALSGAAIDGIRAAAARADEGTRPASDLSAQADYRRHLAKVLTGRAVSVAARA